MPAKSHGMTNTKEYRTWENMKKRCHCVTDPHYPRWGGRGIFVCDEWKKSFMAFYNDIGPCPSKDHQIERINNDGPYCKDNCRWAHKSEQAANTRKNVFLVYKGERKTVSEWARTIGIDVSALKGRIYGGWPVEKAIETPSYIGNRLHGTAIEYLGQTKSVAAWARQFGVPSLRIRRRLASGMSIHDAIHTPLQQGRKRNTRS